MSPRRDRSGTGEGCPSGYGRVPNFSAGDSLMPGPAPKDAHFRHRGSRTRDGEWLDLEPIDEPILHGLPEGEWSPRTLALWEAWRLDPATRAWSPADVAFAVETAYLAEVVQATGKAAHASEFRQRLDSLGLTAKGKRNLRWRVVDASAPASVAPRPAVPLARDRFKQTRRARLQAVDPATAHERSA